MRKTAMFDSNFEVFYADTDFGKSINKQIRYQVFCLERGFEDATAFSNREESDHWDEHAVHFIVRSKKTGKWLATTRIIFAEDTKMPVEQYDFLLDGVAEGIRKRAVGEISRFCIVGNKMSKTDGLENNCIGTVNGAEQYEITSGLFRAIGAYSEQRGISQCFIMITPAMARMLKRIGVAIYQAGDPTEFHGTRIAHLVDFKETAINMKQKSAKIKNFFESRHLAFKALSRADVFSLLPTPVSTEDCEDCLVN